MATILTVHGTFASGPERGNKWWQNGSIFESCLRELVEAEVGELHWQSSIWDGLNSECARRVAGAKLYSDMKVLELGGGPYCVIGHSHGGSVVSAALIEAAKSRNALHHLGAWLTIGTPFISMKKDRLLFSRLATFGKAAYAGLVLGALVGAVASSVDFLGEAVEVAGFGLGLGVSGLLMVLLQIVAITLTPLLLLYVIARYLERNSLPLYNSQTSLFASESFAPRWMSLWHSNDEAVQGLRTLRTLDVDIFSKSFAVPVFRALLIALLLLTTVNMLYSPEIMNALYESAKKPLLGATFSSNVLAINGKLIGEGSNVLINAMLLCSVLGQSLAVAFSPIFSWADSTLTWHQGELARLLKSFLLVIPVSLFAVALMWLVQIAANWLSWLSSKILNPVAVQQIKATGFGSDTDGDYAIGAGEFPMWLGNGLPPLPEPLGREVEEISNSAAAAVIPKFRSAIKNLSLAKGDAETSDMLSHYLTWDELIHTSYFNVPKFRKLVAYALAQNEGFRATAAFTHDPDYKLVAAWYEEIVAGRK